MFEIIAPNWFFFGLIATAIASTNLIFGRRSPFVDYRSFFNIEKGPHYEGFRHIYLLSAGLLPAGISSIAYGIGYDFYGSIFYIWFAMAVFLFATYKFIKESDK